MVDIQDELSRQTTLAPRAKTPGDVRVERWQAATRWRRRMDQLLMPLDLTFTRWFVLECTRALIAETGDAVSQGLVARRAELDNMTTSYIMRRLQEAGCIDRGPDMSGPAYRIILTEYGRWAVAEGRELIEASAA